MSPHNAGKPTPGHAVVPISDSSLERFIEEIRIGGQLGGVCWGSPRVEALVEEALAAFDRYLEQPDTVTALTALTLALVPSPPHRNADAADRLPSSAHGPMVGLRRDVVLADKAPGSLEAAVQECQQVLSAMLRKCTAGPDPESMDPALAWAAKHLSSRLVDNIIAEALPAVAQHNAPRGGEQSASRGAGQGTARARRHLRPAGLRKLSGQIPLGPVAREVAKAGADRLAVRRPAVVRRGIAPPPRVRTAR